MDSESSKVSLVFSIANRVDEMKQLLKTQSCPVCSAEHNMIEDACREFPENLYRAVQQTRPTDYTGLVSPI
jgi:hypothetical protein